MVSRDETGFELRLNRHFNASPERVWRAWTDPQALRRWFGPTATRELLQAQVDVRVSGQYLIGFVMHDKTEHDTSGAYQYLDLAPLGRNEHGPHFNLGDWVRHHDRYETHARPAHACHAST